MKSLFFGTDNTAPSNSATQYHYLVASDLASPNASETNRQLPMPVAGVITNFYFTIDTPPGAGTSWTIRLRKNTANTSVVITISDSATTGNDTSHSVAFYPGDILSVSITPSNTPTVFTNFYWDMECNANGQPVLGGNGNTVSNSTVNYSLLQGGNPFTWSTTENTMTVICPTSGTLSNLYTRLSGTPGVGTSYNITVVKNGVDSSLTTSVADTATTGNDTSHSVAVVAGDTLSIKVDPVSSPTARAFWWGILFTPTLDGESFFGFGNSYAPSASLTGYEQGFYMGIANATPWTSTESNVYGYIGPQTLKKIYMSVVTAPGGVATRTLTVRKNAADTALATTITGVATGNNATSDVTYARGDTFALKSTASGSPAAATGGVHGGFLVYNAPLYPHRVIVT